METLMDRKINLMTFLDRHNLPTNSVLIPYIRYLQTVCDGVWVVGATARKLAGYASPPHPEIGQVNDVIDDLKVATGENNLSYLYQDFAKAYQLKESQRRLDIDLDIVIATHPDSISDPLDPFYILCTGLIDNLGLDFRYKPNGISFSTREEKNALKIDITDAALSRDNYRDGDRLSFDDLKFLVDTDLNVIVPPEILSKEIDLKIIGEVNNLNRDYWKDRSKRMAIRLLVQSQIERNGKRVSLNFGDNEAEVSESLEWLLKSFAHVMVNRGRKPELYHKFLYAVLNWRNLDPVIQLVITNAFKLAGLVEADLKSSLLIK